jgi:hypothetical protein
MSWFIIIIIAVIAIYIYGAWSMRTACKNLYG